MKNNIKIQLHIFVSLLVISFAMGLIFSKVQYDTKIKELEKQLVTTQDSLKFANKNKVIIHQADNYGGEMIGTITEKAIINGHYTVTIGAYGKFLVNKEQYDSLSVGDEIPDYLKQRGSVSNE
ncbi:DUF1372 family protein [Streptococcus gordonii]|uniref:DUF1372 family protein n=1 Tax=Streptococcus gordonii TaxID=1302 RepID=UPI0007797EB4|nr:DUF1372 family protein [Streptococcus gordonii]QBX16289.1 hypothetical protein Javan241_0018 [Streptococcus phage Javan241]